MGENMIIVDEGDLTKIVASAVFVTFMIENWVNHSVAEAEEQNYSFLKALATPPPLGVFAGMAVVTIVFSVVSAWLADKTTELVVGSPFYVDEAPNSLATVDV